MLGTFSSHYRPKRRQTCRGRKPERLVRKPDAGKPPVRFDERDVETEVTRLTAPHLDSTTLGTPRQPTGFRILTLLFCIRKGEDSISHFRRIFCFFQFSLRLRVEVDRLHPCLARSLAKTSSAGIALIRPDMASSTRRSTSACQACFTEGKPSRKSSMDSPPSR